MAAIERVFTITEIEPGITIGSWQAATDLDSLDESQTKVVLSLAMNKKPDYINKMYADNGIIPYEIHIDNVNGEDIARWFPRIYAILNHYKRQGVVTLVHCVEGISRSVVGVASYLLIRSYIKAKTVKDIKKPIADEVVKYVCSKRKHSDPLPFFVGCLRAFEASIRNGEFDLKPLRAL